ncbi:MAG: tRNA preQ1(34) S-adenosylmethionine ribosyltransferase-isomerase QueA [Xanthomonadales bacterium]|nr:tRNA preQ1(34) S-adenosylmethionine ribosyltransferase-isomerase QueA [Xanthomonadales bacterium]MCC6562456.1 tRNA preQ1(34) S-adenosylmethionine ribosyltransferase-isomerase QueA [Xanthomonadales bacterium]
MKKSDFHFELPTELIAQSPLSERSASRLLVLDAAAARCVDGQFRDLVQLLQPGDLLVLNDTRVIPARLYGRKSTGGEVEVLIERVLGTHEVRAQMRASKTPKEGTRLELGDGVPATVLGRDGEFFRIRFDTPEPLDTVLHRIGQMPLPPYIHDYDAERDRSRYQTVFAREPGAVAAPTAGLHFDAPLLDELRLRGVKFGHVTLHVGAGTFQPMRVESVHEHRMHAEWLNVGAELCQQIRITRAAGHRVVAVGTTVVRALESASRDGVVQPFSGETQIFIFPGYRIRSVDALITNFHLPESTLLMLVSAFAGRERVLAAYAHAVRQRYRFFSYGDAMFITPPKDS